MNNKTIRIILVFGFRIIWRIMEISEGVIRLGLSSIFIILQVIWKQNSILIFNCYQYHIKKYQYFPWVGGLLLGILSGGVPPVSPNHDPISDQKMSFSTPIFRPEITSIIIPASPFWIHISFFLFHLELKWQLCSYIPVVPFENHIRFQTKLFKAYTRFRTETGLNPYPLLILVQHIPIWPL